LRPVDSDILKINPYRKLFSLLDAKFKPARLFTQPAPGRSPRSITELGVPAVGLARQGLPGAGVGDRPHREPLPDLEKAVALPEPVAAAREFIRVGIAAIKQVVVAWNRQACADGLGEGGGLEAVHARAIGPVPVGPVDGEEGEVYRPAPDFLHQMGVPDRLAGVEEGERAEKNDEPEVARVAPFVAADLRIGRVDAVEVEGAALDVGACVRGEQRRGRGPEDGFGLGHAACRDDDLQSRIRRAQRQDRLGVEAVGGGVAADDMVDSGEEEWIDDLFGNAVPSVLRLSESER